MTNIKVREAEGSYYWEIVVEGDYFLDGMKSDKMYIPDWSERDFLTEEQARMFVKDFLL